MSFTIDRPEEPGPRLLPVVTANPYELAEASPEPTVDQRAARQILSLVHQPLSRFQRLGWRLTPRTTLVRLLYLHRQAITAELRGQLERANFWWTETRRAWAQLPASHPGWSELAGQLVRDTRTTTLATANQVREWVARELLLDTHLAFYNGYVAGGDSSHFPLRAEQHWIWASALLTDAGLSAEHQRELHEKVNGPRIEYARRGRQWREAIRLARTLFESDPENEGYAILLEQQFQEGIAYCESMRDWPEAIWIATERARQHPLCVDHQNKVAELMVAAATCSTQRSRHGSGEESDLQEAARLEKHIRLVEVMFQEFPTCHAACEALAMLYHLQAVKFANGNRPSQALLANAHALAYKPNWEDAQQAEEQIEKVLEDLSVQLREVQRRLGSQQVGNRIITTSLNADGLALMAEANAGTKPRDSFRRSKKARDISTAVRLARAKSFWLRAGIPVPAEGWDERAGCFDRATDLLLAKGPDDMMDLLQKWEEVVQENPELRMDDVDPMHVVLAFMNQSEREEGETEEKTSPPTALGTASNESEDVPLLPTVGCRDEVRQQKEPFDFWFFSWRSPVTKLLLIAASVLLIVGGVLTVRENQARAQRNQAFAELQQAATQLDPEGAQQAITQFENAAPLGTPDTRQKEIQRVQALLEDWPALRQRNEAFDKLQKGLATQPRSAKKDLAILQAAETFLQAHPSALKEPRQQQVLQWYNETFARWMTQQDDPNDAEVKDRIALYRTLTSANE